MERDGKIFKGKIIKKEEEMKRNEFWKFFVVALGEQGLDRAKGANTADQIKEARGVLEEEYPEDNIIVIPASIS